MTQVKLSPLYKKAAESKVMAAVRSIVEANPEIKGTLTIPLINLPDEEVFKGAYTAYLQELMLEAEILKVINHDKIQEKIRRRILATFTNTKEAFFTVDDRKANIELEFKQ